MAGTSKYKPEFVRQVTDLLILGAASKDIANFFEVDADTVNAWRAKYPDFDQAILKGRRITDIKVAKSVLERILGYDYVEEHIIVNHKNEKTVKTMKKHLPPEAGTGMEWLARRWPDLWRNYEPEKDPELPKKELEARIKELAKRSRNGAK